LPLSFLSSFHQLSLQILNLMLAELIFDIALMYCGILVMSLGLVVDCIVFGVDLL
jgi:hypothetical protein